jgi:dipeptidyl aminopeptidase/acylaminoacyl peptidase
MPRSLLTVRSLLIVVASFTLCLLVSAQQPARRAMTVDDALNMAAVSNPLISPDGQWVLYTRSELNWKENKRVSSLWMSPATPNQPHVEAFQFTGHDSDTAPQWSPDSKHVAFIAARGKEPQDRQIWLIRVNGGEAVKLSEHKDGLSAFRWSKDSKQIFFLAADAKSEEQQKKEKEGEDAIFVDEGANGQSRSQWSNLWVINLADKKERQITKEKFLVGGFDPAPDGTRLVFTARRENTRNSQNLSEIHLADVATGAVTRLTENEAPEQAPQWNHAGTEFAYLAPDDKTYELAGSKLFIMNPATKHYRRVSNDFAGGVGSYVWSPDDKRIIYSAQSRTNHNLFEVDVTSGKIRPVTEKTGVFQTGSHSADRSRAAAVYSHPQQPPEIWVVDFKAGKEWRITDTNPQIKELALAKSEVVRWKSKDGLEIEGILYLPADYREGSGRLPLILNIHGGPAGVFSYSFNPSYHVYAGLGYASLAPNVRGSSGYSDALLRGNMRDLGGGDYHDLMTGVDYVIARGIADPDKLGVKGWSYGGILGGWTITQTNRFKAASLGAMVSDWTSEYAMGFNHDIRLWYIGGTPWENPEAYRRMSAFTHIKNVATPTLILHGENDTTDTIGQSMIFYQGLKDRGVTVRFIRFPREPHGFREPRHQRTRDVEEISWMQKHIRGIEWTSVRPPEKDEKKAEKKEELPPNR